MRIAITIVALVVCMLGYGQKRKGATPLPPIPVMSICNLPRADEFPSKSATQTEEDIPFAVVEEKPMFEECRGVATSKQFSCFKKCLDKYAALHFRFPEEYTEACVQGKVIVSFLIKTDGCIEIIRTRGPDKLLEREAQRIIEALPRLIPGRQGGKPVSVTFAYPIYFRL